MLLHKHRKFLKFIASHNPDFENMGYSYNYIMRISNLDMPTIISYVECLRSNRCVDIFGNPPKGIWILEKGKHFWRFTLYSFIPYFVTTAIAVAALINSILARLGL